MMGYPTSPSDFDLDLDRHNHDPLPCPWCWEKPQDCACDPDKEAKRAELRRLLHRAGHRLSE